MLSISKIKTHNFFCLNGENNQIVVYLISMLARCHFSIVNFDASMFKGAHNTFALIIIFLELIDNQSI
jgi:hypothetical protein